MLPIGGAMMIASVVGAVAVMVLLFDTLVQRPAASWWLFGWCAAALVVAAYNLRRGIEVMSAFDWRPLVPIALTSVGIVALYPGWWL